MAKVNIVRWDATNLVPQLLSSADTAMINNIDVTGSAGTLSLGGTDASAVDLGSATAPVTSLGAFTASLGAEVKVKLDIPSGSDFIISGTAAEANFNGTNFNRLFNGSNVDDLHVHAIGAGDLTSSLIQDGDFTHLYKVTGSAGVSGTQVVYLAADANEVDLADSDAVSTSRIIGIASGTTSVTYNGGADVPVFTVYGDRFDGFTGLTAGAVYYLGETPGSMTTTPSTESGRMVVQVGIATSTTELILQPDIRVRGLS